jgi:hypothetical protein
VQAQGEDQVGAGGVGVALGLGDSAVGAGEF